MEQRSVPSRCSFNRHPHRQEKKVFLYATAAARILIAKNWKGENMPSITEWQKKLCEFIELAKMTAALRLQSNQTLRKEWQCVEEYMKQRSHSGCPQKIPHPEQNRAPASPTCGQLLPCAGTSSLGPFGTYSELVSFCCRSGEQQHSGGDPSPSGPHNKPGNRRA